MTPSAAARVLPLPTALVFAQMLGVVSLPLPVTLLSQLLVLFFAGVLAHGRLAEERPVPERLTEFYFLLSLGGVLGGALNALVAPLVFDSVLEYPLVLVLALALRRGARGRFVDLVPVLAVFSGGLVGLAVVQSVSAVHAVLAGVVVACLVIGVRRPLRLTLSFALLTLLVAAGSAGLHTERTFFGVLRVTEQDGERQLFHGTTLHGVERFAGPLAGEPLTYYGRRGPLGDVFAAYPRFDRVDAIGLGVGTLAAYGRPGERLTFYELDPAIARVAGDPRYFTYLRDSQADVEIVLGDGRRTIAQVPDGTSDLVIVDAFSSDSVPVHLITREALELLRQQAPPRRADRVPRHEPAPRARARRCPRCPRARARGCRAQRSRRGSTRGPHAVAVARDRALGGTARAAAREVRLGDPEGLRRTRVDRRLLERPQRRQVERLTALSLEADDQLRSSTTTGISRSVFVWYSS